MPSCCRDKVNRSTGRRAAGVVFAKPSGQFHHEMTTSVHLSGLVPSRQLSLPKTFVHLSGLAKTTPTALTTPMKNESKCHSNKYKMTIVIGKYIIK